MNTKALTIRSLFATALFAAVLTGSTVAFTNAQAVNVQQWAKVRPYFHTMLSQPSDLVYHESIEAAFAYAKKIFENCNNTVSPPICKTYTNLRPWSPGPGDSRYNGVAAYWMTDTVTCQGQSCTTASGGLLFEQFLRCSEGKPTYFVMQINSDPYDRQMVCKAFVPDIQPCDDCDGKGNPIVPSGAEKIQIETDYVAASGGLRFVRTYRNSTGFFSSFATASLIDNRPLNAPVRGCQPGSFLYSGQPYSYCNQFLSNGTQTYQVRFADGRFAWFGGTPGAFTAKADIKDKLSQRTNPSGAIEWVLQRADDSTEIYDAQGALIRKTSRDGQEDISYVYSSGQLIRMTDRVGRSLDFSYDGRGRLATMTDPAGGLYQYAYDNFNNLASVAYPGGTIRQYHYNEVGNVCNGSTTRNLLTGVSENGQRVSTFKYDCSGVPVSTERAGGVDKYSFSYGGTPGAYVAAIEIDPLGTSRTHSFNQILSYTVRRSTSQPAVSGTGTVSDSLNYDTNGNVSWRKDFNGNRTNFSYDLTRNLQTQRIEGLTAAGANTPQTRTINTEWHPTFRLPTRIAEPLRITTNVYDADGTQCGARGALCSRTIRATTDANGSLGFSATPTGDPRTWSYTYNGNGSVLTVDGPRTDVSDVTTYTYYADDDADFGRRGNVATITNALGHRVDITDYNAHGQPTRIVDANALVTTLAYDPRQRLTSRNVGGEVTTYDYDPVGQLERVTLADGSYLNYGYDAARRVTEISDNLGNRIVYTLDNAGNRTAEEVRDPANVLAQRRTRVYNALNRLFKDLGAQNQTTEYAYDNQGNVTSVKDPLNHITTNQYDALHRLVQVNDPGNGVTKYEYNGLDALTKVTDPRNLATNYTVNGLGNLTLQASPDTGNTASTYDAAGNVATQTDAKNQVTTYAYDALNRVSSITFHDGSKHNYSYDAGTNGIGRLTSITELNAVQAVIGSIAYGYDLKGRVSSDTRTINGVAYVTGYRFDSYGRLDRITYPSGRTVDFGFDALGRVSSVNATPAGGSASSLATGITYHPFGGVKSYTFGNCHFSPLRSRVFSA
jgi:YD repeat-containing protein